MSHYFPPLFLPSSIGMPQKRISSYNTLSSYFDPIYVTDGPSFDISKRYVYDRVGFYSTSKRSSVVALRMDFKNGTSDPIDRTQYAIGVIVGDIGEWGSNLELDNVAVCFNLYYV